MTTKEMQQQSTLSNAYREYGKLLGRYAFFKVHDHAVSEDLVQETFMKTWKYLMKGGKIETMKAFLYRILNNLIVDEYRKRKATSLDVLVEKGYELSANPSERLINVLDGTQALHLIDRLPEKYRDVIRMRYVQGLSLTEMAIVTGQSENAVAVQAHRGLAKLKALYKSSPSGYAEGFCKQRAFRSA